MRRYGVTRTVLQRRVLVAALACYVAVVVLAAWRHEIRPRWLDPPAALARSVLRTAGIPPGVAVFSADVPRTPDLKITALCLSVRIVERDGRVRQLHPRAGAGCPSPAPRLWVTGEEIALYRSATSLRAAVAARFTGALHPSQERHPKLLAESIAEHFRKRARARGFAPERYALLWREATLSERTGVRGERVVALMRWEADAERGVTLGWRPDPERLARDWPGLDEPRGEGAEAP